MEHRRPFIIIFRHDPVWVFEINESNEGETIGSERCRCSCPCLLIPQLASFMLFPFSEKLYIGVLAIDSLRCDKHVIFWALGLGLVTLIQDQKTFPHMAVLKLNLEVGPVYCSSLTPHHQAPDSYQSHWGGDPIGLGLSSLWD